MSPAGTTARTPGPAALLAPLLLLAVALLVRLPAHAQMAAAADTFAPVVDSEAYLLAALRVAAGADLSDDVYFQAPLYPWVLGGALALCGVPGSTTAERATDLPPAHLARALAVGRGLNLLFGLATVLLVWHVGRALLGPAAGLFAGLLVALHGPFVFYEGHLLKVSLSLLLLPWAAAAWIAAERSGRSRGHLWTGLALGAGGLVRGNLHLLSPLVALVLLVSAWRSGRPRAGVRSVAAVLGGVALAIAPVVVRNSLVAGQPVLSTAAGGTAFFLCNHAGNDTGLVQHLPGNRQVPRYELDDWRRLTEEALGRPVTPAEISSYWGRRALAQIADDPGRWLFVELRKLGLLVSRYEAPDNTSVQLGEEVVPLLAALPVHHGVAVPLALAGAVLLWRRRRALAAPGLLPIGTLLLGYAATLLLFNVSARFRMPLAPLLLVYAGALLGHLPALLAAPLRRRVAVAAALLLGLLASRVSEGPLGPLDPVEKASHVVIRLKNRAQVALSRGDAAAARADLLRALQEGVAVGKVSPDVLALLASLERAEAFDAAAAGRAGDAEALRAQALGRLKTALSVSPEHPAAHRLLGLLAYDAGAFGLAAEHFRRALAALPGDREARQYLTLALLEQGAVAEAREQAQVLVDEQPSHDDGWGLLALANLRLGRVDDARAALLRYDALASAREEEQGRPRRLPAVAEFGPLRNPP